MRHQVNSYFAVLMVTILGAWATYTIVDVATTNAIAATFGTEAVYFQPPPHVVKPK